MGKLLHFEFHKLIRQKSFYICLAVAIALIILSAYTSQLMYKDIEDTSALGLDGMNKMIAAASSGYLSMVVGVFIPIFVCEDYASGTIRNIVTRGYTRLSIFSAKLICALVATVVMTVFSMVTGYIIGTIFWGAGSTAFDSGVIKILLCQLAVIVAEASLFYAISTVLQKTGGAIAICLVLPMVMTIVLALADTALAEKDITLSGYWIERAASSIATLEATGEDLKKALLTAVVYFVVTSVGSFLAVMKREY